MHLSINNTFVRACALISNEKEDGPAGQSYKILLSFKYSYTFKYCATLFKIITTLYVYIKWTN
jgi:hypothetical protein